MKKMKKLEVDISELEKSLSQLRIIHQAEIERKDAFCEVEKAKVTTELQASYNAMLPGLYAQQFELGIVRAMWKLNASREVYAILLQRALSSLVMQRKEPLNQVV